MKGHDKLWEWFGLSRDSFLIMPRSMMHEMPDEWQSKMADLLNEWDDTWDMSDIGVDQVHAVARKNGKIVKIPDWVKNYRHPDKLKINSIKVRKCK